MTQSASPSPQQPKLPPESAPEQAPSAASQDPERYWLENVYKGEENQLTVRAVIAGMLIGAVMCLSNLYVILKTGWSLGVTITACILSFAAFGALRAVKLVKTEVSALENNAVASVASAAGYMTGGGNMAAVPALLMLTGTLPPTGWLVAWFAVVSALGVFAAIPIKRQLINIEQLPFPTGTATAETLQALHGHDERSRGKARYLGIAGLIGALVAFWKDARGSWLVWNLPAKLSLPFNIGGKPAGAWTLSFDLSLLLIGAGALVSFKTGWSMLVGALLTYGVLAPEMVSRGVIPEVSYKAINAWALWTGASVLVSSGLLSFAFQWRSVAKSFQALSGLFGKKAEEEKDPLAGVECPPTWFPLGFLVLGPVVVALMAYLFQIPWWAGVIALPLSVVMGVIASRVTGETDTTPTKALGPVTQLLYGGLLPGNLAANVMSANATGGVGLHAADLLTGLKSGWLIGASPRKQFQAQLFGVLAGAAVVVPAFNLLVPRADVLGTEEFPAPSSLVWAGVSKMLVNGVSSLHTSARIGALCGLALGVALVLLERWAPKKAKPFIPSASGLGLAIVIPGASSISFFVGAAIAEYLRRKKAQLAEATVLPVSSGFIAGESLMGIAIAMLKAFGVMPK
ncbi:OPT family oligopeptide transporter [Vitiosangium sp. GDMCC 1.1324]|uniref:OPT family oligopeptide transporter n=1 Tax=Vitiosangium sp. (strain GDMCC 1.1324) TaxID=2138576 RepID=UPI000D3AFE8C|nr:OPT family oligopeptide transporter [Vitiosangium sp. GDMCC 1.1324]PTL80550.1 peptide transporter [Vitiosangium sp. GDMCC 1.1324]